VLVTFFVRSLTEIALLALFQPDESGEAAPAQFEEAVT
jgi:hypothetical protein